MIGVLKRRRIRVGKVNHDILRPPKYSNATVMREPLNYTSLSNSKGLGEEGELNVAEAGEPSKLRLPVDKVCNFEDVF